MSELESVLLLLPPTRGWDRPCASGSPRWCRLLFQRLSTSALHIGEFGGNFAVADGEDIHATDVPGLAVAHLAIDPQDHGAIAADDDFLGIEVGVGVAREPSAPEAGDGGFTFDAAAVGSGGRVLEHRVFS
jgi:hypothetical protein